MTPPSSPKIYVVQRWDAGEKKAKKLSDWERRGGIKYTRLLGGNFPVVPNKSLWQPAPCFAPYYSRFAAGILWGPPLTSHKNVSCNLLAGVYSEVPWPCPFPPGRITLCQSEITEPLFHNHFFFFLHHLKRPTVRRTVKLLWTLVVQPSCAVWAASVENWNQ